MEGHKDSEGLNDKLTSEQRSKGKRDSGSSKRTNCSTRRVLSILREEQQCALYRRSCRLLCFFKSEWKGF